VGLAGGAVTVLGPQIWLEAPFPFLPFPKRLDGDSIDHILVFNGDTLW
jgi:hypothetical protein